MPATEDLNARQTANGSRWGVHIRHCCLAHGCKYGDDDCPVDLGQAVQEHTCEQCDLIAEARGIQAVIPTSKDSAPTWPDRDDAQFDDWSSDDDPRADMAPWERTFDHADAHDVQVALDINNADILPEVRFGLLMFPGGIVQDCGQGVQGLKSAQRQQTQHAHSRIVSRVIPPSPWVLQTEPEASQ